MGATGSLCILGMDLSWFVMGSVFQYQKRLCVLGSNCISAAEGSASSSFGALVSLGCSCPTILAVGKVCSLTVMCKTVMDHGLGINNFSTSTNNLSWAFGLCSEVCFVFPSALFTKGCHRREDIFIFFMMCTSRWRYVSTLFSIPALLQTI